MSFETARTVTPESFGQAFQFTRRPAVRYPAKKEAKQTVNISQETAQRSAMRRLQSPYAPKLSYGTHGQTFSAPSAGQLLNTLA